MAGLKCFQSGRFADAAAKFQVALKANPTNISVLRNLGVSLMRSGNARGALKAFTSVCDLRPDEPEAQFNLATALDELGQFFEAEAAYAEAIRLAPDYVDAMKNIGGVYMQMSRYRDAIRHFENVVKLAPDETYGHFQMGVAYQELEEYGAAVKCYEAAEKLDPDFSAATANIGYVLKKLGRIDEAIEVFRRAAHKNPNISLIIANLGDAYLLKGEPDAAVKIADDFLSFWPGDTTMLAFRSAALNEANDQKGLSHLSDFQRLVHLTRLNAPRGYDDLKSFNSALSNFVLNHPSLVMAPESYSTVNGRHTAELMDKPEGPIKTLKKMIWDAVNVYRTDVPIDPNHHWCAHRPKKTKILGWSVVMDSQGYQLSHMHPSGWLSGVYYPKLPNVIADEDPGREGWIEFGRTTDHFYGSKEPTVHCIKPEEGMMLLFPSYFYHRTIPYTSDQHRISIAFDVISTD